VDPAAIPILDDSATHRIVVVMARPGGRDELRETMALAGPAADGA
jgi:hypothetical protein